MLVFIPKTTINMVTTNMQKAKKMLAAKKAAASKSKTQGIKVLKSQGLDSVGYSHARMLFDPCGAPLEESAYPGDRGYVNRFQTTAQYGTGAGATCWVVVIKPGNICSTNFDTALASTPITLAFSKAAYPGAPFLTTNATKARAVSACIAVCPNATPNNCTGTIYFGIVNAQAVANGGTTTPQALIDLCSERVSAAQALMNPLEVKWSPGGFDDRYSPNSGIADDDSDRNCIVVVGTGFPAASGVSYRMVSIVEWAPYASLGITNDATTVGRSRNNITDVARALKQKDSNWWWSLGKKVFGVAKGAVAGYYSGGAIGALGGAVKFM